MVSWDGAEGCAVSHGPRLLPSPAHLPIQGPCLEDWSVAVFDHLECHCSLLRRCLVDGQVLDEDANKGFSRRLLASGPVLVADEKGLLGDVDEVDDDIEARQALWISVSASGWEHVPCCTPAHLVHGRHRQSERLLFLRAEETGGSVNAMEGHAW